MQRIALSVIAGLAVALTLFFGMQQMIAPDGTAPIAGESGRMMEFIRLNKEDSLETKQRLPEREPPKPTPPPVRPKVPTPETPKMATQSLKPPMPSLDLPLNLAATSALGDAMVSGVFGGLAVSGSLIPLVQMEPVYPRRARRLRKEGVVTVEFTITETGLVKDMDVVAADPAGFFEDATLAALARWKFKPKMFRGKAVAQRARLDFDFKLDR